MSIFLFSSSCRRTMDRIGLFVLYSKTKRCAGNGAPDFLEPAVSPACRVQHAPKKNAPIFRVFAVQNGSYVVRCIQRPGERLPRL